MNGIYNVIWSKVKQRFVVVSELVHSCTKQPGGSMTRKMATVLAVLALTASVGGISEAAAAQQWTTGSDAKGNFTAHIDTANTMGSSAEKNKVIGDGNTVNTSNNEVTGDKNTLKSGSYNYVIGDENEISSLGTSWIIGSGNKIHTNDGYYNASKSLIIGSRNTSADEINSTIFIGNENKVTDYILDSVAIGSGMEFGKRTNNSVVIGNKAKNGVFPELASNKSNLVGSNGSVVIGDSASNQSPYSVVIGANAKMGDKWSSAGVSVVIGAHATIADDSANSILIGSSNSEYSYSQIGTNVDWAIAMGHEVEIGDTSDQSVVIGGAGAKIGKDAPHGTVLGSFSKISDGTWYGTAIGYSAEVTGRSSLAIGNDAHIGKAGEPESRYSVALGYQSTLESSVENATALGPDTKIESNANGSVAIGVKSKVQSWSGGGIAIGSNSTVKGSSNIAIGARAGTITKAGNVSNSIALGNDTQVNTGYSVALGSNATIEERSGSSSIVGHSTSTKSASSSILGASSNIGTDSDYSFIGGSESIIGDNIKYATIVGSKSGVSSLGGTAIGYATDVAANTSYSVALGRSSKVRTDDMFTSAKLTEFKKELGDFYNKQWNISSGDGTYGVLSVGDSSSKRRIINVAKGRISSDSYDAINGSQIYHLTNDLNAKIAAAGGEVAAGTNIASIDPGKTADGKPQYIVNAKNASVSVGNNFTLTPTENKQTNITDYNIKLKDTITIGEAKEGNNPITIDGTAGQITGLTNKTLTVDGFATAGRAATEEQLNAAITKIEGNAYKGWTVSAEGETGVAVNGDKVDFSGAKDKNNHKNIVVSQEGTNLTFDLNSTVNVGTGDNTVAIDGEKGTVTAGAGVNKVAIDGNTAKVTVGTVEKTKVTLDGVAGSANIGNVAVDGATGNITGLTNKTINYDGFANGAGRAATEEQLQLVKNDLEGIKGSAYQGWNVSANGEDSQAVGNNATVDFSGSKDKAGNQNIIVTKDGTNLQFGLSEKITLGEGHTQVVVDGGKGTLQVGTEAGKTVTVNGTTGMAEVGNISVNGSKGEVTGLTNTTLDAEDFATVGRAATEEQLQSVNHQVTNNSIAINNLGNKVNQLDNRIDKVGAGAAALAALHPLDFDPDDKWDFVAGYGNYRGENAMALGAFYRPNEDTMFSVGGTMGNGDNMFNAGVSLKFGQGNNVSTSRLAMAKEIKDMRREMEAMKSAMLDSHAGRKVDTSKLQLFPDVPQNHWAYEYVATLAGNGMIDGYPDGNFDGNRSMTRYEFAAVLYRAMVNGATLSDKILTEFAPELKRFTVDTVHTDKDGNPTVERVRVARHK